MVDLGVGGVKYVFTEVVLLGPVSYSVKVYRSSSIRVSGDLTVFENVFIVDYLQSIYCGNKTHLQIRI